MTLFKEIISGRFTNITILLVSAFITVITAFFTSQNYLLLSSNNFTELFSYINSNRYIATFSSFALIITASWMIYKLNDIYTFTQIRSNFPFWFLNLFYLSNPDINYVSQGTITIISLIGILFFIFKSYMKDKSAEEAFMSGVLMGIISLFWKNIFLYFPFVIVSFILMRTISLKSLLALIVGIFAIQWNEFIYYFYYDEIDIYFQGFNTLTKFNINYGLFKLTTLNLSIWFASFLAFVSIMISVFDHHTKIKNQQCNIIVIIGAALSLLFCYLNSESILCHIMILYSFISLLLANIFTNKQSNFSVFLFVLINMVSLVLYFKELLGI